MHHNLIQLQFTPVHTSIQIKSAKYQPWTQNFNKSTSKINTMKNAFKLINLLKTLWDVFISLWLNLVRMPSRFLKNSYTCDYLSFASNRNFMLLTIKRVSLTAITAIVKNYFFNFFMIETWNHIVNVPKVCHFIDFLFFLHTFLYDDEREILNSHLCLIFWFELLYFHATVIFFSMYIKITYLNSIEGLNLNCYMWIFGVR